jgi:spoIIIJ-associated protein
MDVLEISAKTVDEAIEKALDEMGLMRDEVKVTILSEGKSGGIFGIGAEEARVKVERLTPDPNKADIVPNDLAKTAQETLETLLKLMEVDGTVVLNSLPDENTDEPGEPISFNIEGEDLGILIGRRGQTLAALQYILRIIVGHQTTNWVPITVDAEGYKDRRLEALKALAIRMADTVKTRGTPFTLEPMPPYERRIVHLALVDHPAVFTESIGEGESRKVVIRPKRSSGIRNDNPQRRSWNQ